MKLSLSEGDESTNVAASRHQRAIHVATTKKADVPREFDQLHGDGVVHEEVRVTRGCSGGGGLFPPLLVHQVEDEYEEEEEEKRGDGESREDKYANSETATCVGVKCD